MEYLIYCNFAIQNERPDMSMRTHILKQSKFPYYIRGYYRALLPTQPHLKENIFRLQSLLSQKELQEVENRVEYYCAPQTGKPFSGQTTVRDLRNISSPKSYFFDTYEYARFLPENTPLDFIFGDVTHIPSYPSLVKSRPIAMGNDNSVLLNMDKARHFVWIKNDKPFSAKKNRLIGMSAVYQHNRYDFFEAYFGHPLCDLGDVGMNGIGKPEWIRPKISLLEHLDYKFILSLQGNDVATNLKWIMSSNSIAVMPKPTMETWFMEGTLIGDRHYIELRPDYSDLEEKLQYYIAHEKECLQIVRNANAHCRRFSKKDVEDLCSLRVLERYLQR